MIVTARAALVGLGMRSLTSADRETLEGPSAVVRRRRVERRALIRVPSAIDLRVGDVVAGRSQEDRTSGRPGRSGRSGDHIVLTVVREGFCFKRVLQPPFEWSSSCENAWENIVKAVHSELFGLLLAGVGSRRAPCALHFERRVALRVAGNLPLMRRVCLAPLLPPSSKPHLRRPCLSGDVADEAELIQRPATSTSSSSTRFWNRTVS